MAKKTARQSRQKNTPRKSQKAPERSPTPTPVAAKTSAEEPDSRDGRDLFPIVGIGASAGGLEAITQLLKALPADTGMAFVFVQHLAPTHESALAEILSRATRMPVMEVKDEPAVEPNHVYVIPPGKDMVIGGGTLQLQPRAPGRGVHRPVDQFFRALAEDRRHRAIGVILSGTANDGTLGLEAIKGEGGITFAQDATAQHDGMPQSAIASGCVDFVLPPDAIAREIARIARHPHAVAREGGAESPSDDRNLAQLVQILHRATGVDFSGYKFNTLHRRVTRRMVLRKINTLEDYVHVLQQEPAEVESLYHDLLISVTSFFRNPEAFEVLKQKVFPHLVKRRTRNDPVRIWSLGCSTGQEAYSLAIAFAEFADTADGTVPLQVFATDLDERNVGAARAGVYAKDIAQDVSPERLRRFFDEVDGQYRINKAIRDVCVFSHHNVLTDPPFSRMDLISCRNLLIYLDPGLQKKIMPTLHYALKPDGFLWLGGSETIGGYRNLFESEDARQKVYVRKPGPHGAQFLLQHDGAPRAAFAPVVARPPAPELNLHREADRLLVSKFAPPSVLVSADLDILQYRGDTGPYLAPAPGKASLNLLKMLRDGLLSGVRAAIAKAGKTHASARDEGLRVKSNGGHRKVAVEVIPLKAGGGASEGGGGFLILFDQRAGARGSPAARLARAPRAAGPRAADDVDRLAQELANTRDHLQSVIEQQEAANEELQSANEEVQSANEELQSVNEELETSKEEIQSSNEELATVNDELNNRNQELHRANNDLVNLLDSVQIAIIMLGPDLRIRRFTPAAEKLLNLVPADVGRSLTDLRLHLDGLPDLESLLVEVVDTVSVRELEVRDRHGCWYVLRLRPYRTQDNKIDGVVVMLMDVDAMKRAQELTVSIVATMREPLVVLDAGLRVRTANAAFYRLFALTAAETEGRLMHELWNIPGLRDRLEQILPGDGQLNDLEVEHEFEHIGVKALRLNARRLVQPGDYIPSILFAIEDITGARAATKATARLAAIVASSDDAIVSKDLNGVITSWNTGAQRLFGYSAQEVIGKLLTLLIPPDHHDEEPKLLERLRNSELVEQYETVRQRKDGSLINVSLTLSPMRDAAGQIVGASEISRDISERKQAEEAARDGRAQLEARMDELSRINVAAVGRELRMIELKREINDLCERHGEAARFPLDFEQNAKDTDGREAG